jgi:hypothetical protein
LGSGGDKEKWVQRSSSGTDRPPLRRLRHVSCPQMEGEEEELPPEPEPEPEPEKAE